MSETVKKRNEILDIFCSACGAPAEYDIETQNYHCAYCGSVTGVRETVERKNAYLKGIRDRLTQTGGDFRMEAAECTGCGAKIVFAENEALTDCAFCGRKLVRKKYVRSAALPALLLPFRITREEATRRLLDWCAANARRREAAEIKKQLDRLEGFYLPYLLVKGPTSCTVRRENTARVYRCRGFVDEMYVNLSSELSNDVLDGMEPYDTEELREFDFAFLAGQRVKTATVQNKEAAERVREEIAANYEPCIAKTMETRAFSVQPEIDGMVTMPVVLPAYYLRAGEVVAAVNGQTGKVAVREAKDRFLLPWQIKPAAAIAALTGLTFLAAYLAMRNLYSALYLTGALGIFFLLVILTAYSNHYGGTKRFRLRRRILTSDGSRPAFSPPVFYEKIRGEDRPVRLRFSTFLRTIRMSVLTLLVMFLPLALSFLLNGFSAKGLHPGGAAVWMCVFVPVAPIYFLKFGRLHLHERPLIYQPNRHGRWRRYRKKPDLKKAWTAVKDTFPASIIAVAVAAVVLIINVSLVMHWDDVGSDGETAQITQTEADEQTDRNSTETRTAF